MTVCSFEQLKTKVFPWRGSGLFRRGRGKVCQNRGGGITGAREKKRTRRDIDLSRQTFVGFSTKNRGSTRYLLKISPRRVQKSRVSDIGGMVEVGPRGFQQIENGPEIVSRKRSFTQKRRRSSIRFQLFSR